jgi:plastocyanin
MRSSLPRWIQAAGYRPAGILLASVVGGAVVLAAAKAGPQQHTVLIEAVRFSPIAVEVNAGDTIVWKNSDPFPDNVTAAKGEFHSGDIAPDQTWNTTAVKRGQFSYVCTLHPGMKGVIAVK